MAIPIIGPFVKYVGEKTLWRLIRFALFRMAKTFIGKYKPDVHAKKSREWEWENAWEPMINKARETKNPFDDPVVDFIYHHQACYIEDGRLGNLLRELKEEVKNHSMNRAVEKVQRCLDLIEMPDCPKIMK
jgi:hypothetical protein